MTWQRLALRARRREVAFVRFWRRFDLTSPRQVKRWCALNRDRDRLRKLSIILSHNAGVEPEVWREAFYSEHPRQ